MRETLEYLEVLIMQKTNSADYPQVTTVDLGWLGGCLDSDGCLSIFANRQKKYKIASFRPQISWSNSSQFYISEVARLLSGLGLAHYVHWRMFKGKNRGVVLISGLKRCSAALNILQPYIRAKQRQAQLIRELCELRLAAGASSPGLAELQVYEQISSLNSNGKGGHQHKPTEKSSETIRKALKAKI